MIKINQTERSLTSFAQNFKEKPKKEDSNNLKDEKKGNSIGLYLTGLAVAGLVLVGMSKLKKTSLEEALKEKGVELKNGFAFLTETGEKYSGKVEHLVSRTKKETVEFVDGLIKEKVYHNTMGKPLNGIFYKDGVKRIEVGEGDYYSIHLFDKKGNLTSMSDAKGNIETKFDKCRDMIQSLKDV